MPRQSKRRSAWLLVLGVLFLGLFGGLLWLRKEANGIWNALSPSYWIARSRGDDLYNAQNDLFKRGSRSRPEVCLTIDDGPHAGSIEQILTTLKQNDVRATFFVVGMRVRQHPEFVREMLADGEEVGNHTEDHQRLDTLTMKQVQSEISDCEQDVEKATGHRMTLMRPPGMRFTQPILKLAKQMGYVTVDWNVGAKDFTPTPKLGKITPAEGQAIPGTSPDDITQRVLKQIQNGSIILLHDDPTTAAALPSLIKDLKDQGYQFRTTTEMLAELPQHVLVAANPRVGNVRVTLNKTPHVHT